MGLFSKIINHFKRPEVNHVPVVDISHPARIVPVKTVDEAFARRSAAAKKAAATRKANAAAKSEAPVAKAVPAPKATKKAPVKKSK